MDFSTNQHSSIALLEHATPARYQDLCFDDASLAILSGNHYFLIHEGVICRASPVLKMLTMSLDRHKSRTLEGRTVLSLPESADAVALFLKALYDGMCVRFCRPLILFMKTLCSSFLRYDVTDFALVSKLLHVVIKYKVQLLHVDLLRGLSPTWPSTLAQWDIRESKATNPSCIYAPQSIFPHPMCVNISLAFQVWRSDP